MKMARFLTFFAYQWSRLFINPGPSQVLTTIGQLHKNQLLVDLIGTYLSEKGLRDDQQHGFTKGRSTGTQLLGMTHEWALYRNNREEFDCVYFDYSKAFDRVDHKLLIAKMIRLRIDTKSIRYIQDYLHKRKFNVKVNSVFSSYGDCSSGIPQESCIGPLLFCVFTLDIKDIIPIGVRDKCAPTT